QTPSLSTFNRFTVNSPSKKQTAILLFAGSKLLSITNKSLSSNPAPIIDCPLTRAKKVASLFFINTLSKDNRCSLKSSAGDGNPAEMPASKNKAPELLESSGVKNVNGWVLCNIISIIDFVESSIQINLYFLDSCRSLS